MSPSQAHRVEGEAISSELRQEVAHRVSDDNQDDHDDHGGDYHDGNGHDDGDRVEGEPISSKLGQEVAYQVLSERQR